MFWAQSADRVNYICEQNSCFLLCWAHQPLPLGCTFSRIQHNAPAFLAGQSGSEALHDPHVHVWGLFEGCRVPEVCLFLCLKPEQLHHHRAKPAQFCQDRVKMRILVWALALFRSESQQVLTHQVPCLFHAANSVFFVFLLLPIG